MIGIELVQNKDTKEAFPLARRTGHRVILAARQLGAILRPLGDVIVLMPPLSMTRKELETLSRITAEAIGLGTKLI
jgi:adenosylmethionine-8-amino-7-oxononanoate aminotransferase